MAEEGKGDVTQSEAQLKEVVYSCINRKYRRIMSAFQ